MIEELKDDSFIENSSKPHQGLIKAPSKLHQRRNAQDIGRQQKRGREKETNEHYQIVYL